MSLRGFHSQNKGGQRLLVFIAESNSGGRGLNSDATGTELSSRAVVQIWNNNTSAFEDLDIGTNNLLGHAGLESQSTTEHSWELELANIMVEGNKTQYLVKAGQGGSTISQWNTGGSYYTTLENRVDAAIAACGISNVVFWYTHGINDRIAGTTTGTFKSSVQSYISNLKVSYPGAKFIILKNMTNNGNDVYNTVIQEIDDADVDVVAVSCSTDVQVDGNHWTYAGQKTNANNLYNAMISNGW